MNRDALQSTIFFVTGFVIGYVLYLLITGALK